MRPNAFLRGGDRPIGVIVADAIALPALPSPARLAELGVARVSYGPYVQRVALTALQDVASTLYAGGVIPEGTRALN